MGEALKKEDQSIGELTLATADEHGQTFAGTHSGAEIKREDEIEINESDLNTEGLSLDHDKEFLKDALKQSAKQSPKAKLQKSEDDLDIDKENEHLKEVKQKKPTQGVRLGGGKRAIEEAVFDNVGAYKNLVDEIAKDPLFTNKGDVYPQINGNYFLLDHLVDGGMAKICRARYLADSATAGADKLVVIKMVQEKFSSDPEYETMFLDEIKVSFGLQHPNISTTFDYGKIGENLFVSMEYIHGKDLKILVDKLALKKQVLPFEITLYIISKMCEGLFYAHNFSDQLTGQSYNIVHRDISPHNIMVSFEGYVKVIDFGIAKADTNEQVEQEGTVKGKINYFAPEYLEGKSIDHRYDQFAIGLTFWELLTGKKTFDEKDQIKTIKAIFDCKPKKPSSLNPKIPKEIEDIVMKTLSRDPKNRYSDLSELNRAITAVLHKLAPGLNQHDLSQFMIEMFKKDYERDLKKLLTFGEYKIDEIKDKINKYRAYQEELRNNPEEKGNFINLDLGFAALETSLVVKKDNRDDSKKKKMKKKDGLQAALMGMVKIAESQEKVGRNKEKAVKEVKNKENVFIVVFVLVVGLYYFRKPLLNIFNKEEAKPLVITSKPVETEVLEENVKNSESISELLDAAGVAGGTINFKLDFDHTQISEASETPDVVQTAQLMQNKAQATPAPSNETSVDPQEIERQKLIESMRAQLKEKSVVEESSDSSSSNAFMEWLSSRRLYKMIFD